jgi:hypothetical protein
MIDHSRAVWGNVDPTARPRGRRLCSKPWRKKDKPKTMSSTPADSSRVSLIPRRKASELAAVRARKIAFNMMSNRQMGRTARAASEKMDRR